MERDLASHIRNMADQFHGLELQKCLSLAFEFADQNEITMPESWKNNHKAEKDWLGFKERHR